MSLLKSAVSLHPTSLTDDLSRSDNYAKRIEEIKIAIADRQGNPASTTAGSPSLVAPRSSGATTGPSSSSSFAPGCSTPDQGSLATTLLPPRSLLARPPPPPLSLPSSSNRFPLKSLHSPHQSPRKPSAKGKEREAPQPPPSPTIEVISTDEEPEDGGYGDDDDVSFVAASSMLPGKPSQQASTMARAVARRRSPTVDPFDEFRDLQEDDFGLDEDDDAFQDDGLPRRSPPPRYSVVTQFHPPPSCTSAHSGGDGGSSSAVGGASNSFTLSSISAVHTSRPKALKNVPTPPQYDHPWASEAGHILCSTFKLNGFRPNQLEAINATLAGQDVFVLMPTGGGKSLCYQLPALVTLGKTSGITIVVSPLISLIQDQVGHLTKLGITAIAFTSDLAPGAKKEALLQLEGGPRGNDNVDGIITYVTPEMLAKSGPFQSLLSSIYRRNKLARFVIDEAHCVSSVR